MMLSRIIFRCLKKTALDPISELEKIQLFKQLIDHFPKTIRLKDTGAMFIIEMKNLRLFSVP